MRVLQTLALPLGYVTLFRKKRAFLRERRAAEAAQGKANRKPAKRLRFEKEEQQSDTQFSGDPGGVARKRRERSLLRRGAGNEARTRYLHLGKVALYQMSYARKWCLRSESNQRHADFQSAALPTELQRQMATKKGLEPSTSGVTGRRSNQLSYLAVAWWEQLDSNQ